MKKKTSIVKTVKAEIKQVGCMISNLLSGKKPRRSTVKPRRK
jgi:hypothetical protein